MKQVEKSYSYKQRIFAVYEILKKNTNEDRGITTAKILQLLNENYNIETTAETVASDIEALKDIEIPIDETFDNPKKYIMYEKDMDNESLEDIRRAVKESVFLSSKRKQELYSKLRIYMEDKKDIFVEVEEDDIEGSLQNKIDEFKEYINNEEFITSTIFQYKYNKTELIGKELIYAFVPLHIINIEKEYYVLMYGERVYFGYLSPRGMINNMEPRVLAINIKDFTNIKSYGKRPDYYALPKEEYELSHLKLKKLLPEELNDREEKISFTFNKVLLCEVQKRFGDALKVEELPNDRIKGSVATVINPELLSWIFRMGTGFEILSTLPLKNKFKQFIKDYAKLYNL